MSSGQNVQETVEVKDCTACDFHALVEVFIDHETHTQQWDCPVCGTPHTNNSPIRD